MTGERIAAQNEEPAPLGVGHRITVLVIAFLGWMFAGTIMALIPLAGRDAVRSFGIADEGAVGSWFSFYICAFLLGAAAGGLLFGWLGDRLGRARAMALSILCYSLVTGCTYWVDSPAQLLVLRFLACLGVGGMWPNGVALASEAWSEVSRPMLAGLIGTAANVGFMIVSGISMRIDITEESWRWVFLVGSAPAVLGLVAFVAVPESSHWKAGRMQAPGRRPGSPVSEVFRPPLLKYTLIGICLGAVPLMGNWGSANWMVPWAAKTGGSVDPALKAWTQWCKSGGGAVGALLGGWVATFCGRRKTYFFISLAALATSFYIFRSLAPGEPGFLYWVFVIGFFGTIYFGWLPLYLPELFPTRVRATGSGVTFNWGRIATAVGVVATGQLMVAFEGDYARVGQLTCLVYVFGMVVICFAPDTSGRKVGG